MSRRFITLIRLTCIFLDLMMLNFVFFLGKFWFNDHIPDSYELQYLQLWVFINGAWLGVCWLGSVYQGQYVSTFETFSRRSMHVFAYFLAAVMLYLFFWRETDISRQFLIYFLVSFPITLFLNRVTYLAFQHYFKGKSFMAKKVIILGYNDMAKKLIAHLEQEKVKTEIIGFCEDEHKVMELTHYPLLSPVSQAMEISRQQEVTDIYSTIAPEQDRTIYQLMQQADDACIRFKVVPDLSFFIRRQVHVDYLNDIPLLSMRQEPLEDVGNRIRKRLFDLFIAVLATILILSWLIPIIALLIWLDNRGPIFFIQQRSGLNNKPFGCIKFRSMRVNQDANKQQATKGDARITRIGRFLRKSNLDEMPQFLNVLTGDMSVVGPRPHMLKHTDDYSKLIKQYMVRQFLKPGITGWAQVNGFRGETKTLEEMRGRVEYDIWYMENWNLWLDTKIILKTAYNMVRGDEKAY